MKAVVVGKDPAETGQVALYMLFHGGVHRCYQVRNAKEAVPMLLRAGSRRIDKVFATDAKDIEELEQCGIATTQLQRQENLPQPKGKLDSAIMRFFSKYGTSRFYEPLLQFLLVVGLRVLRKFGRNYLFGKLLTHRVGHLAYNTHAFLCKCKANNRRPVIMSSGFVASEQLLKMTERATHGHITSPLWQRVIESPYVRRRGFSDDLSTYGDVMYPLHRIDPDGHEFLDMTDDELRRAMKLRVEIEVNKTDYKPFYICFHARDKAYLNQTSPTNDWRYHDYRDSDINTYLPACRYLVSQGYKCIRVGMASETKLEPEDGIIDFTGGDDFMQIFLMRSCRFFLGSSAGLTGIANIFQRKMVLANWVHLEFSTCFRNGDIFIPKKVWHNPSGKHLSLREILENGVGRFTQSGEYAQVGLELHDNTPEEITDLVKDMLVNNAVEIPIFKEDKWLCSGTPVRLGKTWADKNGWWLK